jgi:hypothetical protein
MKNPKTDACVYILTGMLQRQEMAKPGYNITEMIAGVESDMAELPVDVSDHVYIDAIFSEALSILKRAQQQLTIKK